MMFFADLECNSNVLVDVGAEDFGPVLVNNKSSLIAQPAVLMPGDL